MSIPEGARRRLKAEILPCKTLERHLGSEWDWWFLTTGFCSCELYYHPSSRNEDALAKKARSYENRGWSKAKIERAIRDHRESTAYRYEYPFEATDKSGLSPIVREIIADASRKHRAVHLVVHNFRGLISQEEFKVSPGGTHQASQFQAGEIAVLWDKCYKIVDWERPN